MQRAARFRLSFALAGWLLLAGAACAPPVGHVVEVDGQTVIYHQIASRRISRTVFEYDFQASHTDGARPVAFQVSSVSAGTEVIAGLLIFQLAGGPVAGVNVDVFTLRQDRSQPFDPAALQFAVLTAAAPSLLTSDPAPASRVSPSIWPALSFAAPVPTVALLGFGLQCDGEAVPFDLHTLGPEQVVLNPRSELPTLAACAVSWTGPTGAEQLGFDTAGGAPATVVYDRSDDGLFPPFPDDTYLVPDATTLSGQRVHMPPPTARPGILLLFNGLTAEMNLLDGWSPQAGIVVLLSEAPDPDSIPESAQDSLDPLASIGLFDLDPASPDFGQRHPFELTIRANTLPGEPLVHQLVAFPSRPLRPLGRYGFVVTRRALASGQRPFGASAYFETARGLLTPFEAPITRRTREPLREILARFESDLQLPIPEEDVALALSISVRSIAAVADDPRAMKEQVLAMDPPQYVIDSVTPGFDDTAALIQGRWLAPDWRAGAYLQRDDDGVPELTGERYLPFRMTLPVAALDGPVPITLYQHGNPGSSNEVFGAAGHLSPAGFAVIGFTDLINHEFPDTNTQFFAIFGAIVFSEKVPDFYIETYAEQMAFLRLIESLGDLDLLPLGAPDGIPDVDPTLPLTYEGISFGGVHGGALMPYAPEIRAAALVAGGGNFGERLFHQDETDPLGTGSFFFTTLPGTIPDVRVSDIWVGLQWFQAIFDNQDPNLHALFTYGDRRFPVNDTLRKPSILIIEGITDSFSPENATRSEAFATGPIPQLEPIAVSAVVLEQVGDAENVANIDAETTAGLVQYVPFGVPGVPATPDCGSEGHFCAQRAQGSLWQRTAFYRTAVDDGVPSIIDPAFDGDGDGRPDVQEIAEGTDRDVAD